MANRYSKALKHLKNKNIDEKLQLLSEIPTNNTAGLYVDVPGTLQPPETVPGDLPLNQGLNLIEDGDGAEGYTGNDTTGLFLADGTIKSVEPPGDTSYILGPMMSMWYAWANYTQIGYVRQSDRKMVNLGRITGEMSAWDGATGFTGYGQLSIEQAVWFKGQTRADYRAFYPGPPSNPADEYGRYIGSMISSSKSITRIDFPDGYWKPGTNRGFNASDDLALLMKDRESDKDRSDEIARMVLNATMLGLDIVAVLALIFPEPGSSIAGAAHLATKLRYVAKLRRFRGALNPFGQRAVRSGAAGRVRRQVFSGRPYQGKRGFGKTTYGTTNRATARTYSNPGPLKGTPGTGSRVNPRGTVDSGTLPQRYIDKYGSRSVLGQKQVKLGPKAAKRTFGEENKFILEQINNYLLETAATGSGLGGGTEIADGYVDKVSETSSPEQLEKASDDANNIATAGGKGLSDANLLKIDKDAEEEAKRVTNIKISNPDSLSGDQLFDSLDLMYESDPEITMQLLDQYEYLIDSVKLDKEYEKYTERKEYISSQEFARNFSPEYARQYDTAQNLWNNYFSKGFNHRHAVFTRDNVPPWWGGRTPEEGQTFEVSSLIWDDTGREFSLSEYQKVRQWSAAISKRDSLYLNKIYPEMRRQRELAESGYKIVSDAIFRPSLLAMIRGWNEMFGRDADINDDPFSIKDYVNQDGSMSEADKKRLKAYLSKMGPEYAKIAAIPVAVGLLATPAGQVALAAGAAAVTTLLIQAGINVGSDYNAPPGRTRNLGPGESLGGNYGKELTPQQQADVEAAGNELRDARRALDNLPADATDTQKDMAQERLDKANKNRTRVRNKNKTDNKNRKESYEPQFLNNRERKNLTEIVTPKQKRILREIKKPVQVKEMPTKFKVKPTGRNNKSVGVDMMKIPNTPAQYKPPMNVWGKGDYNANVRSSQEKKNEVLELVGAAEHHWTYMTEDSKKQKQERINEMMSAEFDKQLEMMYEQHRIKENKLNKTISAVKKSTDIKPEYPENPPPQLDPETGMHPKYGKRYKHDKLDPHSAEFMPPTGNPEIDANVKKATNQKEKARKLKILFGKKA